MTLTEADPRHGTINGYTNQHCRCPRCRAAALEYQRQKRARDRDALRSVRLGEQYVLNLWCSDCWAFTRPAGATACENGHSR